MSWEFEPVLRVTMIEVARASIRNGLARAEPLAVHALDYAPALRSIRASFVTLHRGEQLRGCIGTLVACRSLVEDVAFNAFSAAFRDPRFKPLSPDEEMELQIHISILSTPEPMTIGSEADLLAQLRPGIDGLIIQAGGRRATFLPSVWEGLPDAGDFIDALKRKAGIREYDAVDLQAWRYGAESFSQ